MTNVVHVCPEGYVPASDHISNVAEFTIEWVIMEQVYNRSIR